MTDQTESTTGPRVVVVGGGFGGLESAFYLRMRLGARVRITLVSDNDHFLFKPNTIYIPFGKDPQEFVLPLREAAATRDIEFVQARATGVEPRTKKIHTANGAIEYDYLVLATGATMRPEEIPGLQEHANTIWTPDEMMRLRDSLGRVLSNARQGQSQRVLFAVPPNNKCAGPLYEMVMMLDTWLRRQGEGIRERVEIVYATYEKGYIQAFGPRLDDFVTTEFAERGITGHKQRAVTRVEPDKAHFQDGSTLPFDLMVSFPPYVASTRYAELPSDERGFIQADPKTRQVVGHPDIYVVGDAGNFPVKQAFLALLQADAAAEQLSARILQTEPRLEFEPVSMCIMEQYDKATFAQVPLRLTGDPDLPVEVDPGQLEHYKVGSGRIWQVGKKMLGAAIPYSYRHGKPFHAGATWATMEAGLNVMKGVFAK